MAITSLRKPPSFRAPAPVVEPDPVPSEMTREDICNVEPVTAAELEAALRGIGSDDDARWALTMEGLTCLV